MINKFMTWFFGGLGGACLGVIFGVMLASGGNPLGVEIIKVNFSESQDSSEIIIEEVVLPNSSTAPKEELKAETKEAEVVKSEAPTQPAVVKVTPVTPSKEQEVKPSIQAIYTYEDYEKTILGTCPSERDKSNSWERGNRLNALGIVTTGNPTSTFRSLNYLIENWWNDYKLGKWTGKHMMSSLNNMAGFDNNGANSRVGFYINFDDLSVTWGSSDGDGRPITVGDEQAQQFNKMASDGTVYLGSLESRYKAKCPND